MRTMSYEQAIETIQNTCELYKIRTTLRDGDFFPQGTETDDIQDDIILRVKYKPLRGSYEYVKLEFIAIARYMGSLEDDELIILADVCNRLGKCICQLKEKFKDIEVSTR